MTLATAALQLTGVDAGYGHRRVLRDVSLAVAPGLRVALIGPNGAGKSSLFRVALGTLPAWRGSVELFGVPARRLDRRRHPIAYVPQARQLSPSFPLSARDVVAQGRIGRLGLFRPAGRGDRAVVDRALENVGLAPLADRPFGGLSGGQQQRVLLARALASEARLCFLDEPVTGVDAATQARFGGVLDDLVRAGCAVIVSTHDLSDGNLGRFDWLICLDGTVVAQGPPGDVVTLDVFRQLFAGRPASALGV